MREMRACLVFFKKKNVFFFPHIFRFPEEGLPQDDGAEQRQVHEGGLRKSNKNSI